MARVRGREAVGRYLAAIPEALESKILRGAARAAAAVIADDAKNRCISSDVREAIKVATETKPGSVVGKVQVKGPGAYIAPWLEYGTAPHFISVDDSQREGRSVARINSLSKDGSLVIGGKFVGTTVWHKGATAHPFLRPALDANEVEAIAAAKSYITARIGKIGVRSPADAGDDE